MEVKSPMQQGTQDKNGTSHQEMRNKPRKQTNTPDQKTKQKQNQTLKRTENEQAESANQEDKQTNTPEDRDEYPKNKQTNKKLPEGTQNSRIASKFPPCECPQLMLERH